MLSVMKQYQGRLKGFIYLTYRRLFFPGDHFNGLRRKLQSFSKPTHQHHQESTSQTQSAHGIKPSFSYGTVRSQFLVRRASSPDDGGSWFGRLLPARNVLGPAELTEQRSSSVLAAWKKAHNIGRRYHIGAGAEIQR
jgi:hypothetical protein